MALIPLHLSGSAENRIIYVNLDQVVTIRDFGDYSHIVTSVPNENAPWQFSVDETASEIISLIKAVPATR